MSLRKTFIKHVGPAGLSSCRLHEWLAILRRNRFAVDVGYWPRAAFTTFNSVLNSFWSWREKNFDNEIANTKVPPPLIVLGISRSGTTHLHNLLSKDDRFAFPTTYQAIFWTLPHVLSCLVIGPLAETIPLSKLIGMLDIRRCYRFCLQSNTGWHNLRRVTGN